MKSPLAAGVAAASKQLGVSELTIRNWVKRGALSAVPKIDPIQIEPESLRRVSRALSELRGHGQDRDWMQALIDNAHDRQARKSDAVQEGIAQLNRGQLEPA